MPTGDGHSTPPLHASNSISKWKLVLAVVGGLLVVGGGSLAAYISWEELTRQQGRNATHDAEPTEEWRPWLEKVRALARLGDLEGLRQHLSTPAPQADAHEHPALRKGAWLCLLGDEEAGRRVLMDEWRRLAAAPPDQAHRRRDVARALVACAPDETIPTQARPLTTRPGMDELRRGHYDPEATRMLLWRASDLELVALYVASDATDEQLLKRARTITIAQALATSTGNFYDDSMRGFEHEPFSPWNGWGHCVPMRSPDPEVLLQGAGRALKRAADAAPDLEGPGCLGCPASAREFYEHLAATLRYYAAFELTRRGRLERARDILATAERDHPASRVRVSKLDRRAAGTSPEIMARASVHLAAEAPERALPLLADAPAKHPYVAMQTALLHAATGNFDQAWQAVHEIADDAPMPQPGPALDWIRAALALQVRKQELVPVSSSDAIVQDGRIDHVATRSLPFWWSLRLRDDRDEWLPRIRLHPRLEPAPALHLAPDRPGPKPLPAEVLPAAFRVMAACAPADPEPLIEQLIDDAHVCGTARLFLRAGLEQARWRGDVEATRRWQLRVDAMLALIDDQNAAVLADLVEL